jgi:hypothetical protein
LRDAARRYPKGNAEPPMNADDGDGTFARSHVFTTHHFRSLALTVLHIAMQANIHADFRAFFSEIFAFGRIYSAGGIESFFQSFPPRRIRLGE